MYSPLKVNVIHMLFVSLLDLKGHLQNAGEKTDFTYIEVQDQVKNGPLKQAFEIKQTNKQHVNDIDF